MSNQVDIENKEKVQALSLAKECYTTKLDLLTNATVVDDAIRFVSDRSKKKLKPSASSSNEDNKKEESKEPEYNEDKGRLEEQTSEITTNRVF